MIQFCAFWCLSSRLCILSYQSLENGKRMFLLWGDEDRKWQQAVETVWLLPGPACPWVKMVAEPGEQWFKQTPHRVLHYNFWTLGVHLLTWVGAEKTKLKSDSFVQVEQYKCNFLWVVNVFKNTLRSVSQTTNFLWTEGERAIDFRRIFNAIWSQSVQFLRKKYC